MSTDYLRSLQNRPKWSSMQPNLNVNDIVLMKEDSSPSDQWKLERVIKTHPGDDNLGRVCTIRTASGLFRRPIV